ncbi:MAG: hypothetical protein GIX03_08830 [Candidatus Eremiobacteraeota bacterium]|nr:hypothetical protein [Candidatus Eremiobacteraeota bacterium]MBC5803084.1 hypothetical protein [Candidatus Eremiobacteraeota bacterium]MBC5823093.1 hypothetical protein [Candidatus Eremiobacteraeota bacterium]
MPLAGSGGPSWGVRNPLSQEIPRARRRVLGGFGDFMKRFFGSVRPPRAVSGDDPGDEGAAGAGDRSPLIPRVPVLSGAAAKRLPSEVVQTWAVSGRPSPPNSAQPARLIALIPARAGGETYNQGNEGPVQSNGP